MHPLIETNREAIARLCRRFGVQRLDVFGSAATTDFDPDRSDFDFAVEFDAAAEPTAFDCYFGLREGLESLLHRPVDLVTVNSIRNPFFRRSIESRREAVFG